MILTQRLELTNMGIKDVALVRESLNDPMVQNQIIGIPFYTQVSAWYQSKPLNALYLIARDKITQDMVGVMILQQFSTTLDIGGWVCERYRHKGYVKEAYEAVMKVAKECGTHKLTANCITTNERARELITTMGFTQCCVLREHAKIGDQFVDVVLYEKLLEDGIPVIRNTAGEPSQGMTIPTLS